jgi:hypothetical protein
MPLANSFTNNSSGTFYGSFSGQTEQCILVSEPAKATGKHIIGVAAPMPRLATRLDFASA